MAELKEMEPGERYGRLVVTGQRGSWIECRCDCGATKIVAGNKLRGGEVQSCGCLKREQRAAMGRGNRRGA